MMRTWLCIVHQKRNSTLKHFMSDPNGRSVLFSHLSLKIPLRKVRSCMSSHNSSSMRASATSLSQWMRSLIRPRTPWYFWNQLVKQVLQIWSLDLSIKQVNQNFQRRVSKKIQTIIRFESITAGSLTMSCTENATMKWAQALQRSKQR